MCVVSEVNMKHLVMTGKEHGLPRAVFTMFKHLSITFGKRTEITGVIRGIVVVVVKCQSQVSLTGSTSGILEY